MSLTIYGSVMSSAMRCHLLLSYLGLEYDTKTLKMSEGEHKSQEYLRLNPNGKVPVMVEEDGSQEFILFESYAINNYLANKHKPQLLGQNLEEKGLVAQWSYWGAMEAQHPIYEVMYNHRFNGNDPEVEAKQRQKSSQPIAVLDSYLQGKSYLVGEELSLADINLIPVFVAANMYQMLSEAKNVQNWLFGLSSMPVFSKVLEKMAP